MRAALLLVLAVVLGGCFQVTSVLTVRPDGSATLRDEVTLSGMGLMALAEEGGADPWADLDLEARAAALGEGVRLASFEPREDGFTAVYEVDDVRRIEHTIPEGIGDADDFSADGFRYLFEPAAAGGPATLRVLVPKPAPGKPTAAAEGDGPDEVSADQQAQALGMARGLLGDARLTVAVEVEGEIVETTARHAEAGRVALLDLPFGPFLDYLSEHPELMTETQDRSPAAFFALVDQVEDIRMEPPGTVRIRFR